MGRDFTAQAGDVISALVVGWTPKPSRSTSPLRNTTRLQNRKVVAQYLKQAPRPTLGKLLEDSFKTEEDETEEK